VTEVNVHRCQWIRPIQICNQCGIYIHESISDFGLLYAYLSTVAALDFCENALLKKGVDKWCDYTGLSKYDQCAEQEHYYHYGQQPISFSEFCKLPKFYNKGFIGHVSLLNIFLKISHWAGQFPV
jgi:hypothetical protein